MDIRRRAVMAKMREPVGPLLSGSKPPVDRVAVISGERSIGAPAERCFKIIAGQLEETPQWDPMILRVKPVSVSRRQIGATSRLIFDLGGRRLEPLALISVWRPNQAVAWISNDKPRVTEDWHLERRPNGTMVSFILRYTGHSVIDRLIDKLGRRKRVEQAVNEMLSRFKALAESGHEPME
jgi:uncharacterized membrane protein